MVGGNHVFANWAAIAWGYRFIAASPEVVGKLGRRHVIDGSSLRTTCRSVLAGIVRVQFRRVYLRTARCSLIVELARVLMIHMP